MPGNLLSSGFLKRRKEKVTKVVCGCKSPTFAERPKDFLDVFSEPRLDVECIKESLTEACTDAGSARSRRS